jgi:hypothetical protein
MSRTPQPRAARRLDLAAILTLVLAAAVYGRAWTGMRALEQVAPEQIVRGQPLVWALDRHHDYLRLSRAGLALGVVGLGLAVAGATVTARDVRRRRTALAG